MPKIRNLSNVNVGITPNDGTGDLIRDAFVKINDNTNEIYSGGQFIAFNPDTRLTPGYAWANDRDTGMYRPGSGRITFTLNGNDGLSLSEDSSLTWFGKQLATQEYVTTSLASFTGGVNSGNITVNVGEGANANIQVTVNGIPTVNALPTSGNYEGRLVFFTGDVWIFSCYPAGNGVGLPANPSIARAAGSDCRWTRFRGEGAVSVGVVRPPTGVEGQTFYETANNKLYVFLEGQWKTMASVLTPDAPAGLEVLASLPLVSDPDNFEGRTVVVGTAVYIFITGIWKNFNNYVSGGAGDGITSGTVFPSVAISKIGELFRKEGINAGLYIFNGTAWETIAAYADDIGRTAGIKTYGLLPAGSALANFNAGDLIIVGSEVYILNSTKTSWDLFRPGGTSGAITVVSVSAGSIGTDQLAANSVTAAKILAGSIITEKIAANAITSTKIAAGTIGTDLLAANAITAGKIQAGAIGASQIAAGAITADKIGVGAITAGKIAAGAINAGSIQADSLSAITQNAGTITAGILRSSDNKMIIDLNNKFIRIEL